jgi:DnaK suppressor protein
MDLLLQEEMRSIILERLLEDNRIITGENEQLHDITRLRMAPSLRTRCDAQRRDAWARATKRRMECEIQELQAAIQRIDAGLYGTCRVCGRDLSFKRLARDPAAQCCAACCGGD